MNVCHGPEVLCEHAKYKTSSTSINCVGHKWAFRGWQKDWNCSGHHWTLPLDTVQVFRLCIKPFLERIAGSTVVESTYLFHGPAVILRYAAFDHGRVLFHRSFAGVFFSVCFHIWILFQFCACFVSVCSKIFKLGSTFVTPVSPPRKALNHFRTMLYLVPGATGWWGSPSSQARRFCWWQTRVCKQPMLVADFGYVMICYRYL